MSKSERALKIADNAKVENATQRTITIIGGKGAGKTTLIKMLLDQEKSVLCLNPLNVINGDIEAYRIPVKKEDTAEKLAKTAKVINQLLNSKKNVVLYFNEMLREEITEKMDILFPLLQFKDGFVFLDEVHEFCPHFSGSQEIHRFIRHCRNKNIGIVMSTQRPASVDTNVIGLTDYLVLFRITWKNDIEAVKELLKYRISEKEEMNRTLSDLQHFGFMEGYAVDFQAK
jgi:ABC-type cobalamin/Fe3+-siderophores transport system ATPase subunit